MRIALVTEKNLLNGYTDTSTLIDRLAAMGANPELVVWDDPTVDWREFDLVYLHTPWDYIHKFETFLRWAMDVSAVSRLINSLEVVRWNSTKQYLVELGEQGVPIPKTLILPAGAPLHLGANLGEVVVKPTVGAGGEDVYRFSSLHKALADKRIQDIHASRDMLIQDFEPRVLVEGEYAVVFVGDQLTHAVLKTPGQGEFRIHDIYGGTIKPVELTRPMQEFCREVCKRLPYSPAYGRIDFIGRTNPILMEVELIEPELFLVHSELGLNAVANALVRHAAG